MDAVVNLAFSHDWSKFAQNAEDEIKGIEALGSVLDPGKLLVVTSGVGLTSGKPGHVRMETATSETRHRSWSQALDRSRKIQGFVKQIDLMF
jgi:hypothetical protein